MSVEVAQESVERDETALDIAYASFAHAHTGFNRLRCLQDTELAVRTSDNGRTSIIA